MRLTRFAAVCFFLQGALPLLLFGLFHPAGVPLLLSAAIYAAVGWGVWNSRIGALIGGVVLTLPQLFILSSSLPSWQFYVGGAIGFGIAPARSLMDIRFCVFSSYGVRFDFAISERSQSLIAAFPFVRSESFLLLNIYAAVLLASLVFALRERNKRLQTQAALTDGPADNTRGAATWNN